MIPEIFCDFEANNINPYIAEIITGYFKSKGGKTYDFNCKANKWSEEAEKIHKITEFEANMFDSKEEAFSKLLNWLPNEFNLICYSNNRSQLGTMLYDDVLLKMNLMDYLKLDRIEDLPVKIHGKSVHTLVKEAHRRGLIEIITNGKAFELGLLTDQKYAGTNRVSFRQSIVYYSLFEEFYEGHNAQVDTNAMIRIYDAVTEALSSGISLKNIDQLELI